MLICERGCMPDKPSVYRLGIKSPSGPPLPPAARSRALLSGLVGEAQGLHALDLTYVYVIGGVRASHYVLPLAHAGRRRTGVAATGNGSGSTSYLFLTKTWKSIWVSATREMSRVRDRLWNYVEPCARLSFCPPFLRAQPSAMAANNFCVASI